MEHAARDQEGGALYIKASDLKAVGKKSPSGSVATRAIRKAPTSTYDYDHDRITW